MFPCFSHNSLTYISCLLLYQVFQKRFTGEVDFYRGWVDYKNGFGSVFREYWWGGYQQFTPFFLTIRCYCVHWVVYLTAILHEYTSTASDH